MENYRQLCVWPSCNLGENTEDDFARFMKETFGVRARFAEVVTTLPDYKYETLAAETGGRTDLLFFVHDEDLAKFAAPRLSYGIRWWEDWCGNGNTYCYPPEIVAKYK